MEAYISVDKNLNSLYCDEINPAEKSFLFCSGIAPHHTYGFDPDAHHTKRSKLMYIQFLSAQHLILIESRTQQLESSLQRSHLNWHWQRA